MTEFISFISDEELKKELSKDIRERALKQKLFYINQQGADSYYDLCDSVYTKKGTFTLSLNKGEDYYKFLKSNLNKEEKIAIVSLGCGDAELEKETLKKIKKEGYKFKYIGVDISEAMLHKAAENLDDLDIEIQLVRIDITNDNFKDRIVELTKDYDKRVFAFLGSTLGNANQTDIADTLYNFLEEGDLLWLDVWIRNDLKKETEMKMFKRYMNRLSDQKALEFHFNPLKVLGVPIDAGKMGLKTDKEESVGSLLFTYYFKINKKTVIEVNGEKVHLLPSEEIDLISVRVYHPETFIDFFKNHDFGLIDYSKNKHLGQFLFKKN